MGSSWGHTLTPFTEQELAQRDEWTIRWYREHSGNSVPDHDAEGRTLCSASGKCRNLAAWWGTYRYVTGRAGWTSQATKALCDDHAAKWRNNHGAVEREPTGRPQTVSQAAAGSFSSERGRRHE